MNGVRRKVLLICYYFPPLGLGGVGRPLSLFRELPSFGWDCEVLTVKPVAYRAYEPELLGGLERSKIHRSGSRDPQRLLYLLGKRTINAATIERGRSIADRFFPDSKIGWSKPAIRLGRKILASKKFDAIVSTSPPVSCHLVGRELARTSGLPWLADFRDFWTSYRIEDTYTNEGYVLGALRLLDEIRQQASAITAASDSIAEYVSAGQTIANGYMTAFAEAWKSLPDDDAFTISALGHQIEKHEPWLLLYTLEELAKQTSEGARRVRIVQVGQVDEQWFTNLFRSRGLDLAVDCFGRLGREETVKALARAHVHYLDIGGFDPDGFLPGRTYDLIASGRPILAHCPPDGALGRLLYEYNRNGGRCRCVGEGQETAAVDWLRDVIREVREKALTMTPLSDFARQYSSTAMARHFAESLDKLVP